MITGAPLEPVVTPEEGPAPPIFRPNCHEAQRTDKNFLESVTVNNSPIQDYVHGR